MLNGNTKFISSRLTPSLKRLKSRSSPGGTRPDVKVSFVVAGAGGEKQSMVGTFWLIRKMADPDTNSSMAKLQLSVESFFSGNQPQKA